MKKNALFGMLIALFSFLSVSCSHDSRSMARYLYQRGAMQDEYTHIDSAIFYMERARRAAIAAGDDSTHHDAAVYLAYLNNVSAHPNLAIRYAREAIQISDRNGNARWKGNDYLQLSGAYYGKGLIDSSDYYIRKTLHYVKYQRRSELPDFLNNIAVSYLRQNATDSARSLLMRSLAIRPTEHAYYLLAESYQADGKKDSAEMMWRKALRGNDLYLRSRISSAYAEWLRKQGDYRRSAEMQSQAMALKDSLDSRDLGGTALTANNALDISYIEQRQHRWTIFFSVVLAVLAAVAAGLLVYSRRKALRARRVSRSAETLQGQMVAMETQMESLRAEIASLQEQRDSHDRSARQLEATLKAKTQCLCELERQHSETDRELRQLRQRVQRMENEMEERLRTGRRLHESLECGGNATQWNKHEMDCFVQYYALTNPEFGSDMEAHYNSLSPTLAMMLVLNDMGYDAERVQATLGMSAGAYRTAKSRLNSRRSETK